MTCPALLNSNFCRGSTRQKNNMSFRVPALLQTLACGHTFESSPPPQKGVRHGRNQLHGSCSNFYPYNFFAFRSTGDFEVFKVLMMTMLFVWIVSRRSALTFRRIILSPFSGLKKAAFPKKLKPLETIRLSFML